VYSGIELKKLYRIDPVKGMVTSTKESPRRKSGDLPDGKYIIEKENLVDYGTKAEVVERLKEKGIDAF